MLSSLLSGLVQLTALGNQVGVGPGAMFFGSADADVLLLRILLEALARGAFMQGLEVGADRGVDENRGLVEVAVSLGQVDGCQIAAVVVFGADGYGSHILFYL